MIKKKVAALALAIFAFSTLTGFGLGDVTDKIKPKTEKCDDKKNKQTCKNTERLKSAAKVAAVGVAAKLIYDMAIDFKSKKTKDDKTVSQEYIKKKKALPNEPTVTQYLSKLAPSNVVKIGKQVQVKTLVTVVPSKKTKTALIEEKIEIFDNEDHSKMIKSLVKSVNGKTKAVGSYHNQFTFTLPLGMPQGVYPIRTAVYLNKKRQPEKPHEMQVVLEVMENNDYQIAYLAK